MIYLVTNQNRLFEEEFKLIPPQESIDMIKSWNRIQLDSETTGRDAHINDFLCVQFGNKKADAQIVVDTSTVDIRLYKEVIESKLIIGHNLKFDISFLYNYEIIPKFVYDTMIIEQLLYLGYPAGQISYSLKAVAERRLGIDIDKSIRGDIIWRGLDNDVIKYSAGDVTYLEDILDSQYKDLIKQDLIKAALLENAFTPVIAYLEWCGIKLDANKWKSKMTKDQAGLEEARSNLNNWFINTFNNSNKEYLGKDEVMIGYTPYCDEEYKDYLVERRRLESQGYTLIKETAPNSGMGMYCFTYSRGIVSKAYKDLASKYIEIDVQGYLFREEAFDTSPKCKVNWSSSKQVVEIAKALGFNTTIQDKKTGDDKDSVLEKYLKSQKGINDEFIKLYFDYQEKAKVVSTYGQAQLNMINPNTGRCHTVYRALGAASGRMSCGSQNPNTDLAKLKKIKPSECTYCNFQQLPADDATRSSFISEKDNLFCSCDFSAMESYLGADIYDDKDFQHEFLHGSKDTHSLFAWMVFRKECEELGCTCVADVKKKAPQWRKAVKAVEFAWMFGAAAHTISQAANCTEEEAQEYINRLEKGFKGISKFAKEGSAFVRKNGYVLINRFTGHKMHWWDHDKWLERQKSFTKEFWEEYRLYHKGTGDTIAQEVREHFQAASKWDRMARNAPTQGSGSCITKLACINFFKWIMDNNLFNIVKLVAVVHDEICIEYPKTLENTANILKECMEQASTEYCKFSKIPAEPAVGTHWIH